MTINGERIRTNDSHAQFQDHTYPERLWKVMKTRVETVVNPDEIRKASDVLLDSTHSL
jgi:hypothetical protein